MSLKKAISYLLAIFLFLLPWQTRWIYGSGELNGGFWEYGTLSLYGTEILLWLIVLLFLIERLSDKERRAVLFGKELFSQRWPRLLAGFLILAYASFLIFHSLSPQVSWQFMIRLLGAFCLGVVIVAYCHSEGYTIIPRSGGEGLKARGGLANGWPRKYLTHPYFLCLPQGGTPFAGQAGSGAWPNGDPSLGARDDIWLMASLWLGGVVQGLLALFQFFTQSVFGNKWLGMAYQSAKVPGTSVIEFGIERWLRAYGSFGSPNSLGVYLAVILVLGLILYMDNTPLAPLNGGESAFPPSKEGEGGVGHIYKLLITIGQLLILSGLILSFSRASWLAAAAGVAVLAIPPLIPLLRKEGTMAPPPAPPRVPCERDPVCGKGGVALSPPYEGGVHGGGLRVSIYKQLFYYLLVVILFFIALRPLFLARFDTSNRLENMSISERQTQLADFKKVFATQPLLGVGPGAYTSALQKEYPKLSAWQYQPVHNIYLLALAEFGIIGFVLLAGLVAWVVKNIAKNNYRYLSLIICLLIAGLFDHWLFSLWSGLAFFGVIFALSYKLTINNKQLTK